MPGAVDYLVGFIIFALIELVSLMYHDSIWRTALGTVIVLIASVGLLYCVIVHFGWYLNPAPVSLVALIIKASDLGLSAVRKLEPRGQAA